MPDSLLVAGARLHDGFEPFPVQARHRVQYADEAPEQSVAVKVVRKHVDPAPVQGNVLFPIAPGFRIEAMAEKRVERAAVRLVIGPAKKAEEFLAAREIGEGRELEAPQCRVIRIEIDGDDALRIGRQIVEDVAAAGRNGRYLMTGPEPERFEIDVGIFPDLVVHEPLEHQGREAFESAAPSGVRSGAGGMFERRIGR